MKKRNKSGFLALIGLAAVASLLTVCKATGGSGNLFTTLFDQTIEVGYGELRALQPREKELLAPKLREAGITGLKLNDVPIALSDGERILGVLVGKIEETEYTLEVYPTDWDKTHEGPPAWPDITIKTIGDGTATYTVSDGGVVTVTAMPDSGHLVAGVPVLTMTWEGTPSDVGLSGGDGGDAAVTDSHLWETTGGGAHPKNLSAYTASPGFVEQSLAWLDAEGGKSESTTPVDWSFDKPGYDITVTVTFAPAGSLAGRSFEIRLDADETVGPQTLGGSGADAVAYLPNIKGEADNDTDAANGNPNAVSITIKPRSGTTRRTLSLNAQGSLFGLAPGANVELAIENVTLHGLSAGHSILMAPATVPIDIPASTPPLDNNAALVYVGQGNTFEMRGSAELTGNYNLGDGSGTGSGNTAGNGGAARIMGGTFRMTGADTSVHHNYAARIGGGVYGTWDGEPAQIIMEGDRAEVSFNAAGTATGGWAGGILAGDDSVSPAQASHFVMAGANAKIRGNQGRAGGGMQISCTGSTGIMSGANAEISGNTSADTAGGVRVEGGAKFTMSGAASHISGNEAATNGGGLYVRSNAQFTMSGSASHISGNKATGDGGGIECINGDFTMEGGEISGNSSSVSGSLRLHQFGLNGGTHKFADGVHGVVYVNGAPGHPEDQNSPSGGLLSDGTSAWYSNQLPTTVIKVLP